MKVLTVANRKGGVGKTTQSRTLCEYFSVVRKLRVLAIDLDSQCSLSHLFLDMDVTQAGELGTRPPVHPDYNPKDPEDADWSGRSSSADIFFGVEVIPYSVKYPDGAETLDILPAHKQMLSDVEEQDQPSLAEKVENRLKEFLSDPLVTEHYDIVIVDTGPGSSPLARSGIRACTHVLIPIEAEPQSLRGLQDMIAEIRHEDMRRTLETKVQIVGIQPNRFKVRRTLHNSMLDSVHKEFGVYVSPIALPDLAGFAERDADMAVPRSLFQLPPSSAARKKATEFCEFVERKMFGELGEVANA